MLSPFTFGRTVRGNMFTDREKETAKLRSNFENRINTTLISPRRWGKSSLVEKVATQVNSKKIKVVSLDLFAVKNEEDFYRLLSTSILKATSGKVNEWMETGKKFLKVINPTFSVGIDPVQDFEIKMSWEELQKNYKEVLHLPEKIAKEKDIDIIICIDEFQNVASFENPDLFQKRLRSEWQHHERTTYCLYGSKQHMLMELFEKQSMPFYKFGEIMYLPKIEEKYWIKFIVNGFDRTNKSITEELASLIAKTVSCHPYYVQQLAHLTWINTQKKATAEIIIQCTDDLLNQNAILYYKETEDFSSTQLNFLKAVASNAEELSSKETIERFSLGTSANVSKLKETLQTKEVIDIQMGKVEFIDPAYELWFKKNVMKANK